MAAGYEAGRVLFKPRLTILVSPLKLQIKGEMCG